MRIKVLMIFLILFLIFMNFVSAIAVSGPYNENRDLEIAPRGNEEFDLILYNTEENDVKVKVEVVKGGEFVSLDEDEFLVIAGSQVLVPIKVRVPGDVSVAEMDVRIEFEPFENTLNEGMVQIVTGLSWDFKIKISGIFEKPEELPEIKPTKPTKFAEEINFAIVFFVIFIIILILAIFVVIWLIFKNRRQLRD